MLKTAAVLAALLLSVAAQAQSIDEGRSLYQGRCLSCHGDGGTGGELGPNIVNRLANLDDVQIGDVIRNGKPASGMPAFVVADAELTGLVAYLRTFRPERRRAPEMISVELKTGGSISGEVIGRSLNDLQLRTADGKIALLRPDGDKYRRVTSQTDWPTYHGDESGNRYSELDQINVANVSRLAPAWVYNVSGAGRLQTTPLVVDGVMYATNVNECIALDAGTGRQLWRYSRPRTQGLAGDAASGINRGVAVAGDRLFLITDHAHIMALNRYTGDLLWDSVMADWRQNYGATSAPLVVGELVVSGISGGDEGARGFVAAYRQDTGAEVWRTWSVPGPGEPGSETWGADLSHPSSATWFTGTYDPELDLIYWPVGNPGPDYNGSYRPGDNLYSNSILALEAKSGVMRWYFQYTPHDLWDWDSVQPPVLVDTEWNDEDRKLLLHANRNGFFYVLDRVTGEFLLGEPFVEKLTWASGLDGKGRPVLNPDQTPTPEGVEVCPAVEGATNWFSTSYSPDSGYYYVQTLEKCSIFRSREEQWQAGRSYYAGSTSPVPDGQPRKILRAIDIQDGEIMWELPQIGPANSWGGVLSTAGGIIVFGEDSGALMAVDGEDGRVLWSFPTNTLWKASPITYLFDGKQYFAVASGSNILAFALTE